MCEYSFNKTNPTTKSRLILHCRQQQWHKMLQRRFQVDVAVSVNGRQNVRNGFSLRRRCGLQ